MREKIRLPGPQPRTLRRHIDHAANNPQLVTELGVAESPSLRFAAHATAAAQFGIEFEHVGLDCGLVFGHDPASEIPEALLKKRMSRVTVASPREARAEFLLAGIVNQVGCGGSYASPNCKAAAERSEH